MIEIALGILILLGLYLAWAARRILRFADSNHRLLGGLCDAHWAETDERDRSEKERAFRWAYAEFMKTEFGKTLNPDFLDWLNTIDITDSLTIEHEAERRLKISVHNGHGLEFQKAWSFIDKKKQEPFVEHVWVPEYLVEPIRVNRGESKSDSKR